MGPVNVCYCLRMAKWLLYISLRSHLNVLPADEMKEGGKEKEEREEQCCWRQRERRGYGVEDERALEVYLVLSRSRLKHIN